jgi:hypothetical protein
MIEIYKTIISDLPVALYGCVTWYFTLQNEHRQDFSGQGAEDGVTEGWGKIHELHNLCSPTNIIRVIKSREMSCAGFVAYISEPSNVFNVFFYGNRPLWKPRRRWKEIRKILGQLTRFLQGSAPHTWKLCSYEAPHCVVFSNLLSLHPSSVRIHRVVKHLQSVPPLNSEIKFHTHTAP